MRHNEINIFDEIDHRKKQRRGQASRYANNRQFPLQVGASLITEMSPLRKLRERIAWRLLTLGNNQTFTFPILAHSLRLSVFQQI